MADQKQPKVAIVGASSAGLTLALSLIHHNAILASNVIILETRSREVRPNGAVVLTPNALRILDKLGIYGQIRTQSYPFAGNQYRDAQGNLMSEHSSGGAAMLGYQSSRIERESLIRLKPRSRRLA